MLLTTLRRASTKGLCSWYGGRKVVFCSRLLWHVVRTLYEHIVPLSYILFLSFLSVDGQTSLEAQPTLMLHENGFLGKHLNVMTHCKITFSHFRGCGLYFVVLILKSFRSWVPFMASICICIQQILVCRFLAAVLKFLRPFLFRVYFPFHSVGLIVELFNSIVTHG